MFKYIKYEKVETKYTVLQFRGGSEDVKVNYFDVDVVSIESEDESAINALIAEQDVKCTEITVADFKELVKESAQINRIRDIVKLNIAKKYSVADEIAMMKRDVTDAKRIAYDAYTKECIANGNRLKSEMGYV